MTMRRHCVQIFEQSNEAGRARTCILHTESPHSRTSHPKPQYLQPSWPVPIKTSSYNNVIKQKHFILFLPLNCSLLKRKIGHFLVTRSQCSPLQENTYINIFSVKTRNKLSSDGFKSSFRWLKDRWS